MRPVNVFRAATGMAIAVFSASAASAASLPSGFSEQTFGGITNPTALAIAPDGRVFVSQQCGAIRVIKNGAVLSTPFASISVSCSDERGLHSIAFDPNFSSNGFVYVRYTRASPLNNVIGRLTASPPSSDTGGGLTVLFTVPFNGSSQRYHHGGGLVVGNDGKLYSSFGDHLSGSGQNLNNLWGKVVRINIPNGGIPTDNPFFGTTTGDNRAIWAYGFRNPFTMAIQPGTGRIHVNDVGNSASSGREEVNNLTRGANYNWPNSEGSGSYFSYAASSQGGNAIVGGGFYNPTTVMFPSTYVGRYFFADYGGGWIRSIMGSGSAGSLQGFATGISGPTDVEAANDGSLWYTARNSSNVRRITFGNPPRVTPTPTPTATSPGPTPTPSPTATPAPNNTLPNPVINTPATGTLYNGGSTIGFSGGCTDAEDGTVPASRFDWDIVFHHNTHTHPGVQFADIASGTFDTPEDGEWDPDQWWRVNFTCTDSQGGSRTVTRDVLPRKQTLTLNSSPSGLQVAADGVTGNAPQSMEAVVGMKRILDTNAPQGSNFFERWSDGGAKRHDIFMPNAATSYTATFRASSFYSELTPAGSAVTTSTSDTNVGANTVDNNLATRWSGNGDGAWVKFDLGSSRTIGHVGVAVYQGNIRRNRFDVQVSSDNSSWTTVFSGESSGTTTNEQMYDFADASGRWVRYLGHGNIGSTNPTMNSVTEVSIFGTGGTPIPTPTPTPTSVGPTPTPTATPSTPVPTATPTPTPSGTGIADGYYRIMARHSGKAVAVQSASTANSANVFQWAYGGTQTNDEWQVLNIGGGFQRIINRHSGKDMVVASASTAEGADIFQYAYGGATTNDEWSIVDVGSGYWRVTNRNSGKSAEVVGGGTTDGTDVVQRTYGGATHQQFQFIAVP
jgi:glucose/arabinose dehydrogenase